MKKIIKNRIFIVIITMLICISGTLYATTKYQASEVLYNSSSGDSMTVNEIYNIKSLGNATEKDIANGKTAVVQGQLITGTLNLNENTLENGTYYISVGVSSRYLNVSPLGLANSHTVNYVIKLVVENGIPTVSWHSAPYTGNADLWISPGKVSISK